jgi:ribosomal subunit interface protein
MSIGIQSRGFALTEALREHVNKRLHFTLARGGNRVHRVEVRLSDVNGPRGGNDKRCLIVVSLSGMPNVVVEDTQRDLYAAIDRATARVGRAMLRRLALNSWRARSLSAVQAPQWSAET